MRTAPLWIGLLVLLAAFAAGAEEREVEGEESSQACDCEEQKPKASDRYMSKRVGSPIVGGWFGPEVTFGTIGFDAGVLTAGLTGGIELFGRVGIGIDLGIITSMGDGTMDGWTADDELRGGYVGGIVEVVFINAKFFSWGLDTKLDYGILCRVNASGDPAVDTGTSCDESTTGFILDPRFAFHFRVNSSFRFKLLTGYRVGFFDDGWTGPNKGSFGGLYAGLAVDLGRF